MEDRNNPPPPIPDRPGRPVRIHAIGDLVPENKSNDYVDTTTITAAINAPKRPPKVATLKKGKDIEQQENVTNERREHLSLQICKQKSSVTTKGLKSPELPPRNNRAPPLPPRTVNHGLSRPQQSSLQCNPPSERHRTKTTSSNNRKLQPSVLIITSEPSRFSSGFPSLRRQDKSTAKNSVVTSQPQPLTQTLDQSGALNNTIICRQCGRCRCSHCTGDRQLPERWLCEGNCRCSADSVVDTLSCMCLVKSCFKSCVDNPDGQRIDPCLCNESPKCLARWTALAALSICLPCLCCYWPMQLGVSAATACYNSSCCRNRGCNCEQ